MVSTWTAPQCSLKHNLAMRLAEDPGFVRKAAQKDALTDHSEPGTPQLSQRNAAVTTMSDHLRWARPADENPEEKAKQTFRAPRFFLVSGSNIVLDQPWWRHLLGPTSQCHPPRAPPRPQP